MSDNGEAQPYIIGQTLAKRADKQRLEMKDYLMQDYDLTSFRFNK